MNHLFSHCHSERSKTAAGCLPCDGKSLNSHRMNALAEVATAAMRDALVKAVAENRRRKLPLALWRNGKAILVPVSKLRLTKGARKRSEQ